MSESTPLVYIIDDDPSVRRALVRLIRTAGFEAVAFGSAQEFLAAPLTERPSCLVLDVRLPGVSGLQLQEQLAALGRHLPIVFITGHGDIPMSVRAMKAGAIDFLVKPFQEKDLLEAIGAAIRADKEARRHEAELSELRRRMMTLTPREREVLELVVQGLLNKQIAARLGTTEKTIKVHRARVMEKMKARSLAELVRLAEKLGIPSSA
ncbi:MAG TPA: response regulator transcription factor [Blastocatellia bacterium]|nr:response regulator transcription factor [Blastocatellia bacterium]